eukprot:TRINITY_DN31907_c0_g1_i1.p1 TRINITY_DN31907_c0_g1~~TRINITY_DN31907_c0_g1_i1.p1  ORF type:complete len:724 (+),score=143.42 TRINITY_DN31907_c0_g1_i1:25-2172(+)
MAPADRYGYQLLPTDDLSAAGGPVAPGNAAERLPTRPFSQQGRLVLESDKARQVASFVPATTWKREEWYWEHSENEEVQDDLETSQGVKQFMRKAQNERYEIGVKYDATKPSYVMHPHSQKVQAWNIFLCSFLLLEVIYLPVETAFHATLDDWLKQTMDMFTMVIFSCDLVLQFFLQSPSPTGEYWLFDHQKIVVAYLKGNFFIDLLSILPLAKLYTLIYEVPTNYVALVLHLLTMVKLLRLNRLYRIYHRYQFRMTMSSYTRAIIGSASIVALFLHLSACLWCILGVYQPDVSWLETLMQLKPEDTAGFMTHGKVNNLGMYVMALYFSLYTLTGIGYGDVVPQTMPEYVLCVAFMLFGAFLWGAVLGEIVNVLQTASLDEVAFQRDMDTLLDMCKHHGVKQELTRNLQAYLRQSRSVMHSTFLQEKIMTKMNPELAMQLNYALNSRWIGNVWWLKFAARTIFVVKVTIALDSVLYCPEERIGHRDRLYIVVRGICIHGARVLTKESVWGEDMLLMQDYLRKCSQTVAMSYLHTTFLTREALMAVAETFPEEQLQLRKHYRILCLMRGIQWLAKQQQVIDKAFERDDSAAGSDSQRHDRHNLLDTGSSDLIKRLAGSMGDGHQDHLPVPQQEEANQNQEADIEEKAVEQTKEILQRIEAEVNSRLAKVGDQIAKALGMVTEILQRQAEEGGAAAAASAGLEEGTDLLDIHRDLKL